MANLTRTRRPKGQIATLLLLLTVGILIVALAMANLGHVSVASTRVANAADAATLNLGSQLASHANSLWQSLGQRLERCRRTGLLALILAIIVAIIIVVVTCWLTLCTTTGPALYGWFGMTAILIGAGAVGGAIGGSIGGAIAGTGALQGAIQGAAVGAAIGSAAAAGASLVAAPAAAPLSVADMAAFETAGMATSLTAPAAATSATTTAIAGASGAVLSAASSLYSGIMREQMTSDAFSVVARQFNRLPEHDRIRESVFLDAFNRTVDDPNKTDNPTTPEVEGRCHWPTPVDPEASELVPGDPNDADADGNKTESIPCFEYWIDRRAKRLIEGLPDVRAAIQAFLDGPLSTFEPQAEAAFLACGGPSACPDTVCDYDEGCGFVNECEVDCGVCPSDGGDSEESE